MRNEWARQNGMSGPSSYDEDLKSNWHASCE